VAHSLTRRASRALMLAGALAALIGSEFAARAAIGAPNLALPLFDPMEQLPGYRLRPNGAARARLAGRVVSVRIDPFGRRIVVGAPERAPHTVHVVGDSQVFGWGLEDEESMPSRLQARLGPDFRVVNHGVPGYGPFAYASVVAGLPLGDIVLLVQTEENDLWDSFSAKSQLHPRCGFLSLSATARLLPCPLARSALVQALYAGLAAARSGPTPVPISFHPLDRSAATVLMERVERLQARQRELRGGSLISTFVPWDASLEPERLADCFPRLEHAVRTVEFRDDLEIVARFEAAAQRERLFLDGDPHVSPLGADTLAEAAADAVRARSRPRIRPEER
jgi:hypothetical protein